MKVSTKMSLSSPALDATTFSQLWHPIYGLWIICLCLLRLSREELKSLLISEGIFNTSGKQINKISMFLGNEMLSNIFLTVSHSLLNHKCKTWVETVHTMVLQLNSLGPDDAWRYQRQECVQSGSGRHNICQLCHPIYGLWLICLLSLTTLKGGAQESPYIRGYLYNIVLNINISWYWNT